MKKKKLVLLVCALAVGLGVSLANADIGAGLVGYWPFEEGSGTYTEDASSNSHDGTLINGEFWNAGPAGSGGALSFNPTDRNHVDCGNFNPASAGGELTIALWAKHDATGMVSTTARTMVSKRSAGTRHMFQFFIHTTANLIRLHRNSESAGFAFCKFYDAENNEIAMPVDEWTHIVVTHDGTYARLYLNGEFIAITQWSMGDPDDALVRIGAIHPDKPDQNFKGIMDEVRLYDRVLDEDDVQALYGFVSDPDFNAPPEVDAGKYQSVLWQDPSVAVQLAPIVSDDGKPVSDPWGDPCSPPIGLTFTWSQLSGPGVVSFDPCETVEAPIATFPAAGFYELQLSAFDGEKDACDVVTIYVRPNDDPIAYWDFEDGSGDTVDDESANNNIGDLAGDMEPNWVSGWVGTWAMDFSGVGDTTASSYVDITSDVSAADPNLDTLRYDVTLSAWFKIGDLSVTSSPIIVANGDLGWRLYANHGDGGSIVFTPGDSIITDWTKRTTSTRLVDDGYWHHAVGIYDYGNSKSYLYIDGVLDAETEGFAGMMAEADDKPVTIGARATSATAVARGWNGMIDDVQVYSYCISEARIAALAAMGDLIPQVDAGENQTVSLQDGAVQLAGTATDDGEPNPSLDIEWTSDPCNPGTVMFSPSADIEDPCATFSATGIYVLYLTANDGHAVVSDEVTITVNDPTCQDVIGDELLIVGDVSGPEGTPDCYVDLYDFAVFAGEWLSCNDPQDPGCENPF